MHGAHRSRCPADLGGHQSGHEPARRGVGGEVDRGNAAAAVLAPLGGPARALQRGGRVEGGAEDDDGVAGRPGEAGRADAHGLDQAEEAEHRCGVDVGAPALVVEADVAPDDGQVQGPAGLGHPVDALGELPHHLGVLGVPEVEAVDHGDRGGADAGQVGHPLGQRRARCRGAGRARTPAGSNRWSRRRRVRSAAIRARPAGGARRRRPGRPRC